ncbi:MAG: ThuA domain-containing protein [Balneolaceae bacterium]|nr:ThuA domain-containing protein [Balneolaceae bacterium]
MIYNKHLFYCCYLFLTAVLVIACSPSLNAQSSKIAEFSVHAGKSEYVNTPVSVSLEGIPLSLHKGELQLYEISEGEEIPVASQLKPGSTDRLYWILDGKTNPGEIRNFELRVGTADQVGSENTKKVGVKDDGKSLLFSIGDKKILNYRYAPMGVPDGVDEIYSRGGYIHPIWSPGGEVLSRIQPPDHYHHYGIWNPWTRTEFEGREIDFWNLGDGEGTVRAKHVPERVEGAIYGGFKAIHDHVDFTAPSGEKIALHEQWEVLVWNADPEQNIWIIDFISTLNPATEEPFTIKEYRYQGFSLRATEKWNDNNTELLTSQGYDKSNANATRARWIDVNGISEVEEGRSGILFMTNPGNYNFPELLRIWPEGANGGEENVYINFNPAQDRDWTLKPGNSNTLKYRMVVYDGTIEPEQANLYWESYTNPPKVEVQYSGDLNQKKVLVYTKNGEGYVHENIPYSVEAIKKLGDQYGFEVDASDDPNLFTDENLTQYDALIFSNTNNEAFDTDVQREALQTYIRNGGGFMGIHSASGSERNWSWFSQLLGGNFERHAPRQDFTVEVIDPAHPSVSFLPERWNIEDDECYYLKELNPGMKVVLAADLSTVTDEQRGKFPGKNFGDRFPIAWYQQFEGGRQFYTSLGHRPEQYSDPVFLKHLLGGIKWVTD